MTPRQKQAHEAIFPDLEAALARFRRRPSRMRKTTKLRLIRLAVKELFDRVVAIYEEDKAFGFEDTRGIEIPNHGGVYIIELSPLVVKIGVATRSIKTRCDTAQTYCPTDVKLLAWFEGGLDEERDMQERFEKLRLRGELFWFGEPIRNLVQERQRELEHE